MRIKKALFLSCAVIVATALSASGASGETSTLMRGNPAILSEPVDRLIISAIDDGYRFLVRSGGVPSIKTLISANGDVSVGYLAGDKLVVLEYTKELKYIRTVEFDNEWGWDVVKKLGIAIRTDPMGLPWEDTKTRSINSAFTKDSEGNYYLFFTRVVHDSQKDVENMVVSKYDSNGKKLKTFRLKSGELASSGCYWPTAHRMEISGDTLALFFSKQGFDGGDGKHHSSSTGFMLNKNTFERLTVSIPTTGHSMNRIMIPIAEGGFAIADQSDANPSRGFFFSKLAGKAIRHKQSFKFKLGRIYQETYAKLGGLAQTSGGYIFAATYEKSDVVSSTHNDSRNLFVLTMDDKMENISEPLWITNYTDKLNENAGSPKITALGDDKFLIMWELMGYGLYKNTYAAIVDKSGKRLMPDKELPGVRLNINDDISYNKANGNVYWAVSGPDMDINIYSFNPDGPVSVPTRKGAPVGGYGLSAQFVATSASQSEVFTVDTKLYTYLPDAVPAGLVGAVLVDGGGNIVEVIGTSHQQEFTAKPGSSDAMSSHGNPSASMRAVSIHCRISKSVKPGTYRLRLAYKPDGKDDWRIIARTGVTAVPLTVTAGKATAAATGGRGGLAVANFVVRDGRSSVTHGERFPITLKAVNVGTGVFLASQIGVALVDQSGKIVAVINTRDWGALAPGEQRSQNMSTVTVPKTVARGKYSLMVVARPNGGEWMVVTEGLNGVSAGIDFTVR